MALSKGDFVSVTYTKYGHNVVNAICKVKAVSVLDGRLGLKLDVTKEQGNRTPNLGEWLIYFPGEHCQIYYPEVIVGDLVKITGSMRNFKVGGMLPDLRSVSAVITTISKTIDGGLKYKLNYNGDHYWYDREAFSVNLDADCDGFPNELPAAAPIPVVKKPDPKYKCINPKPLVSNERSLK